MVWSIARHPHGHEVPFGVLNKRDSARRCGRSGPSSRSLRVQIQIQIFIRNGTRIKLLKRRHRRHKSRPGDRSNSRVKGGREAGNRASWLYPCSTVAPGGGYSPGASPRTRVFIVCRHGRPGEWRRTTCGSVGVHRACAYLA